MSKEQFIQHEQERKKKLHSFKESLKRYKTETVILQKYIERPLLYMNKKFDIRVWVLLNHKLDIYLFK